MLRLYTIFLILLLSSQAVFACTTAIISGKATEDGRPLLWKHRDSSDELTSIIYFDDGIYDYIGLVNASDKEQDEVWIGYNETGFAIMNSASYNLKAEIDTTSIKDREGIVMRMALQRCASLADFENLLDTLPKPLGVEANFGVIDARGGAAYYETDNFSFKKIDVNDPASAPDGYIIRTNYSFTGNPEEGYGYIRYNTAATLFRLAENRMNWKYLLRKVSRSLYHSLTGENLSLNIPEDASDPRFVHFQDYIPRHSTSSSIVVQGVNNIENADRITMWTVMGFPLASVILPCWLNRDRELPRVLQPDIEGASPLSRIALDLKNKCFPVKKGSGYKYMNLSILLNRENTGVLQKAEETEMKAIALAEEFYEVQMKKPYSDRDFRALYAQLDELIYDELGVLTGRIRK